MSPGCKGRDWGGWDIPGGCVGAPGGGTGNCCVSSSASPACSTPRQWQLFLGVFLGCQGALPGLQHLRGPVQSSPWPRSRGQPLVRAHPGAARASQRPPRGVPGTLLHGQDTEAQLLPCRHQGQEGLLPPRGSASSRPALPASWDTRREHRGTFLAGSRSPRGLRAAPGLSSSAGLSPHRDFGL